MERASSIVWCAWFEQLVEATVVWSGCSGLTAPGVPPGHRTVACSDREPRCEGSGCPLTALADPAVGGEGE
jgi:hypothetical protein